MSVASRALGSRYELLDKLGEGAMGEVWRTLDRETGHHVAAKVLRSEYSQNSEIVARFLQERAIIRSLQHRNIVRVHDLVVEGDRLAIVMDLIEGTDLRQGLREAGTLDATAAVTVTAAVLRGLAAAHDQGALHRDVKPDNVMLVSGWQATLDPAAVRLTDFGIARLAQDTTVQATGLLGTPEYMPPELFTDGTTSAASDVYAAGVVLYELLAGRTPYAGAGTAYTIGHRAVNAPLPPLPVRPRLWSLLVGMLDKDPRRRPKASAAATVLEELAPTLRGDAALPVQTEPTTWDLPAASATAPSAIRGSAEAAQIDVGATNLDVAFTPEKAQAEAGHVETLTPRHAEAAEAGATILGAATPTYAGPILSSSVDALPVSTDGRRRKILLGVAAGVVAIGLVAGAAVLVSGSSDDGSDKQATGTAEQQAVEAEVDADPVPGTGLRVTRAATYDSKAHEVSLKVTFAADRVALGGPFLQLIPRAKGQADCPLPAWTGAPVQANDSLTTGITEACGFAVSIPTLRPGSPVTATAVYPVDLDASADDPEQQLDSLLQRSADATDQALQSAGPTSTAYAAQRMQNVEVRVPDLLSAKADQVSVQVLPVWGSGSADRLHPLFVSTVGQPTELLTQVAGGVANIKFAEECSGAVVVRQRTVSVVRQSPGCTLTASVGNLSNISSNEFQIAGQGS